MNDDKTRYRQRERHPAYRHGTPPCVFGGMLTDDAGQPRPSDGFCQSYKILQFFQLEVEAADIVGLASSRVLRL
jgi:hypothetical protein